MISDPVKEWQRLTERYAEASDVELRELAAGFDDLTDVAQQVLRDEMKKRGLGDPVTLMRANVKDAIARSSEENESGDNKERAPWILRESADPKVLGELQQILEEAGIPSQTVMPVDNYYRTQNPQLQVGEQYAERAEEILARPHAPIPHSDAVEEKDDPWILPTCPRCNAPDPLLASVDPFNLWRCEECGAEWKEDDQGLAGAASKTDL